MTNIAIVERHVTGRSAATHIAFAGPVMELSMVQSPSLATEARDAFLDLLETELVGPHGPTELLKDQPHIRYVAGHLAPIPRLPDADLETQVDDLRQSDAVDGVSSDDDTSDALEDSSVSRARSESLNSIGVSFVLERGAELEVSASWGQYHKEGSGYRRSQYDAHLPIVFDAPMELTSKNFARADIQWVARETSSGHLICSCFLVNVTQDAARDGTDRLYQVSLEIRGIGASAPFLSRDLVVSRNAAGYDQEDLLYRDRKEFGVGLHAAVDQHEVDSVVGRCARLTTRIVPRVETYVTKSREFDNAEILSMAYLARAERDEICERLTVAFAGYSEWSDKLSTSIVGLPQGLQYIAQEQWRAIKQRVARIENGIGLIKTDARVLHAFRFANECMARMRFQQVNREQGISEVWDRALAGSWYPFQLAFLLSVIPDAVSSDAPYRDLVDVLFFPTGGGKTEAYLGIAAFTMAWRRLSGLPYDGAGVSVLMRYTLRLLTTQQFERAASMIAAAELMRLSGWNGGALGAVPFGIGLWVGPMTPTNFEQAQQALFQAQIEHNTCTRDCALSRTDKLSPLKGKKSAVNVSILTECPWCFTSLCVENVVADQTRKQIRIVCGNEACPFSGSRYGNLPVWFVDSDIYAVCPTILIATVDKFATLPYKGAAKAIFGKWVGYCATCGVITDVSPHGKCVGALQKHGAAAALDLIIQDELHTISDNIGSVYGLYETMIQYLCGGRAVTKYVAATATVKDVARQVQQLYGERRTAVFPPTGLRAGDTYFSEDILPDTENPGRTYIGVYAPTKSRLTTFVSTLAAAIAAGAEIRGRFGVDTADPYLTILGYFNTIRDLGSVKALLGDDVPPLVEKLCAENNWHERAITQWEDELTGRIEASEVPQRLAELKRGFTDDQGGVDFMACTNMISVGVDVPRLGLMVVDGQTKTTSEYIQTTSRVGRRKPGIVIVVYNAMRPRDVSHYEHFYTYHQSYYRFVEAGSVTPFSSGCVDRYIAGAFVAAYRLSDEHSDNAAAHRFTTDASGASQDIIDAFERRASFFGEDEANVAQCALDEIVTKWGAAAAPLQYVNVKPPPGVPISAATRKAMSLKRAVIRAPEDKDGVVSALFVAPTSMRNVESSVPLRVNTYE